MPEHKYTKADLIQRLEKVLGATFGEVDNNGFFERIRAYPLQKGVAGSLIEQCVLGYEPDSKQEPDLLVADGSKEIRMELKTTGMVIDSSPTEHYVAKEPMTITAVGIYDIANQVFETSHFWQKLEHMLIVYYHYLPDCPVKAYDYHSFPIRGYEFHEFGELEIEALRQDWENVRTLAEDIVSNHEGVRDRKWKEAVKQEYIERHGTLRKVLNYIDLAPKFPPRFRLKKSVVSSIIAQYFGYELEQLPGRYATVSDIDKKCHELTAKYCGMTIGQLAADFGLSVVEDDGLDRKGIAEKIIIAMFGGTSTKLNQIELFQRFGIIAKSIVITAKGGRTEDMKLFHLNFEELVRTEVEEENGEVRPFTFEDSEIYSYFANHELLCIMFQEPGVQSVKVGNEILQFRPNSLSANKFIGFKRLVFSDEFINGAVRRLWDDLRDKVLNNHLADVIQYDRDGKPKRNKSGDISSAPDFMKAKDNEVFMRGGGRDSALIHKTECVNGIRMLPQYVWLKGAVVVEELKKSSYNEDILTQKADGGVS